VGTDINAYIEFDPGSGDPFTNADSIFSFDPPDLPRDSPVFSALAGVRGDNPKPVVRPRGLPAILGPHAYGAYYDYIADDPNLCGHRDIRRREADALVESRESHYPPDSPDPPNRVSIPGVFCTGWVDAEEFSRVIASARAHCHEFAEFLAAHGSDSNISVQFEALALVVSALSERFGPDRVRLVFWFD